MGITDKIKNEADHLLGMGKDAVGRITHNDDLRAEGKSDEAKAKAKQAGEHVKDTAKDVKDSAKGIVE